MKKVLFAVFALSIVGVASAQSYGHGQTHGVGHDGYSISTNGHNGYQYNNREHNVVVFNNASHSNGHWSAQPSVHGYSQPVYGGSHANGYPRQEMIHMRRYNNGHDY